MPAIQVAALYRYPVKGFSPESLDRVEIAAGGTFPFDRAFAIENGQSGFDPAAPAYFPKACFLMLMKNERMAEFQTRFDEASGEFRIFRDAVLQVEGSLRAEEGRARIEHWLAENFREELRGPPKILSAPAIPSPTCRRKWCMSSISRACARSAKKLGRQLDPLRFRPNILIDGLPPLEELEWQTKDIRLPAVTLRFEERTGRCAATNVDPKTGARDTQIPRALDQFYGKADFGIYLAAKTSGSIAVGDEVTVVGA